MARKPRDYRAEYARRKAREQERAAREGRPFDPQKARGQKRSRSQENERRRVRYWLKKNPDIPAEDVEQMLRRHRPEDVIEQLKLRFKAADEYEEGKSGFGKKRWKRQNKYWPVSTYWYHGGFG